MRFRRRRRNPAFGLGLGRLQTIGMQAVAATAGGVLTRAIPQMVLQDKNTGAFGYLANAATAIGLSVAAERFFRGSGEPVLLGGAVMTLGRMIEDFFGKRLVEFGTLSGMGSDPAYQLGGEYVAYDYVVPRSSLPAVGATAVAAPAPTMGNLWSAPWSN